METIAPVSRSPSAAEPLAVSPAEAARLAGLGRTTIYAALGSGELKSLKIGKRRLIAVDALRSWLISHEVASRTGSMSRRPRKLRRLRGDGAKVTSGGAAER